MFFSVGTSKEQATNETLAFGCSFSHIWLTEWRLSNTLIYSEICLYKFKHLLGSAEDLVAQARDMAARTSSDLKREICNVFQCSDRTAVVNLDDYPANTSCSYCSVFEQAVSFFMPDWRLWVDTVPHSSPTLTMYKTTRSLVFLSIELFIRNGWWQNAILVTQNS